MAELASSSDSEENYFDASFFVDESYVTKEYGVGPHAIKVLCLQCSSTDYDLTGQLVWPGAEILNDYIVTHSNKLDGLAVIELGSGVGLTGLLCAHYCRHVVMTDHNTTVLKVMKKNVEMQASTKGDTAISKVDCEELEWANKIHLANIKESYPHGFDLILGADICYQQNSVQPLFATVKYLLELRPTGTCKFVLGYVSRFKSTDVAVTAEILRLNLQITEAPGTRKLLAGGAHEGWVYEISSKS